MVAGIGEGSIDILLEGGGQCYRIGDLIRGQIKLHLNIPKKARELRLLFYGEVTERRHDTVGSRRRTATHMKRIYEQKLILDGEKVYPAGAKRYSFEMEVPEIRDAQYAASCNSNGTGGEILSAITNIFAASDHLPNAKWYLDASLDVPLSLDVNKRTEVSLSR